MHIDIVGLVCMVSDVAITTKTEKDDVSMMYTVNHTGDVTSTKPSHLGQGNQIHISIVLVQSNFWFHFGLSSSFHHYNLWIIKRKQDQKLLLTSTIIKYVQAKNL